MRTGPERKEKERKLIHHFTLECTWTGKKKKQSNNQKREHSNSFVKSQEVNTRQSAQ